MVGLVSNTALGDAGVNQVSTALLRVWLLYRVQFKGGVVVISHDSQLLSRVCDDAERSEVWLVEDGQVQRYNGYFEEYKEELVKEISDEMDEE